MDPRYKHLPAYQFFEQLNSDEDVYDDCEKCYFTNYLETKYSWIKRVCCKLRKNIVIVYKPDNIKSIIGDKHCFDLNYWLYHEVYKHLEFNENHPDFYYIIDSLMEVWKQIKKDEYGDWSYFCNPDKTLSDMNFLKEVKALFDNAENYFPIMTEALESLTDACTKYFDYVAHNSKLYYRWRPICTNGKENVCSKYVSHFHRYSPGIITKKYSKWTLFWLYASNGCIQRLVSEVKKAKALPPVTELKYRESVELSSYEKRELSDSGSAGEAEEEEEDELLEEEEGATIYDNSDTEDVLSDDEEEQKDAKLYTTENLIGPDGKLIKEEPPAELMETEVPENSLFLTLEKSIPFVFKNAIPMGSYTLGLTAMYGLFSKFDPINKYYSSKQDMEIDDPIFKNKEDAFLSEINDNLNFSSVDNGFSIGYQPL
ncbi:PIR Superfamily Protein [Plasmodium ovale curtisi]|uniref:PIR Superfamily Protein n=1 Tax=Plasmodium ovale curtisi TaxID=864141 RepID=A0A1A8X6R3_PLAOA|nr:PIR Superfamily Protein [Plasmodium ovale curtisi]SBS99905.1 PIR Superfamily Protein [Plasmodium ovale curtisi]